MKKMRIWLLTLCLLVTCASTSFAGSFSMLASTGVLQLGNNQAWEREYKTDIGKFKIRFRKLWNQSDKKKFHLIVWWNDKRIADGYCPSISSGYSFKIFQDQATHRIFVSLETRPRVVLMGYDPIANRLEKYADSKDYYSPQPNPQILVDRDKDLKLSFVGNGQGNPTTYKLFWDAKRNWFGYKDVTVHPAPRPVEEPEYEPEYAPSYDPPQYEPQQAGGADEEYATSGELYVEETVTGS